MLTMQSMRRKLAVTIGLVASVILLGTVGYMAIEGWDVVDALYMTVITLASVGYKEVHDLSTEGRLFTIVLIIGGVSSVLYALDAGAKIILEGELREVFGRRRLEKKIRDLRNHYIVCGYGRMGRIICRELREKHVRFIVVEKAAVSELESDDTMIFQGDATRDEVLKSIGIERAKGLISVLPTDAENLFVVLSARGLNPGLVIVARASEEGSERKLIRAGADKVVSPYHIGGLRIAHTVIKPAVVDFIEFATKSGNIDLQMEEVGIGEGSPLVGKSLDECGIGRDLGIIIVAIKKPSGEMRFNPTFRSTIKTGDTLIALGESSKLKTLEEMAAERI
ncbi:MAG: potassium channel protein [Thermodesulfovibrionales bacterium]